MDGILQDCPSHTWFEIYGRISEYQVSNPAYEGILISPVIRTFLLDNGFLEEKEEKDDLIMPLGHDFPYRHPDVRFTNEGRKLKKAKSYANYLALVETEEKRKANEIKAKDWENWKTRYWLPITIAVGIGSFILGVFSDFGKEYIKTKYLPAKDSTATKVSSQKK